MLANLTDYIYIAIASILAIMLHEISHGLVSFALGDPTPKVQGRLSLNPLKHLDPLGTICLILFHVGWAKPVVVNPDYYKHKKLGIALVSLAGPLINFILAFLAILILGIIIKVADYNFVTSFIFVILNKFLQYFSIINLGLGIFNLIPIPPLDGSKILGSFLSDKAFEIYMRIERYGFIILAGVLLLSSLAGGGISYISIVVDKIYDFIWNLVSLIMRI